MSQTLRVCTWNIQLGARLDTIVAALKREPDFARLDLLALQEASIHQQREDAQVIAAALGDTYACSQVTAHHLGKWAQANALVWNTQRVHLGQPDSVKL